MGDQPFYKSRDSRQRGPKSSDDGSVTSKIAGGGVAAAARGLVPHLGLGTGARVARLPEGENPWAGQAKGSCKNGVFKELP